MLRTPGLPLYLVHRLDKRSLEGSHSRHTCLVCAHDELSADFRGILIRELVFWWLAFETIRHRRWYMRVLGARKLGTCRPRFHEDVVIEGKLAIRGRIN
jgi:hypothetical protein